MLNNYIKSLYRFASDLKCSIINNDSKLIEACKQAYHYCHWFSEEEVLRRLQAIAEFLTSDSFSNSYNFFPNSKQEFKNIAFYSEENIPLEDFFTVITLLLHGHTVLYKPSEKKDIILQYLFNQLLQVNNLFKNFIVIDHKFPKFDKIIITSRNEWPIKKRQILSRFSCLELYRRQSIGIITDDIEEWQLQNLATDVFSYFGLGCGNIRKLYLPKNFNINRIFEAFENWSHFTRHHAYMNNFQYHQSVALMNKIPHLDNGFILLQENTNLKAPIGVLYYEWYDNLTELRKQLAENYAICHVYINNAKLIKEKTFGQSINQLFLPEPKLIDFVN